jgi:hypothetical protein
MTTKLIVPDAFVLDTDGTVALHTEEERGHYEYSKVKYDRPNKPIIELAEMLNRWLIPIVVTGRMDIDNCRADTVWWYDQHFSDNFCNDMRLFMRPATLLDGKPDHRYDYVVKREIYNKYILGRFNVKYWVDDRLQVCRMAHHDLGMTVLRVGDPDAVF